MSERGEGGPIEDLELGRLARLVLLRDDQIPLVPPVS
jgi:hypothetical protein